MATITELGNSYLRTHVVAGVSSSGRNDPNKSEGRAVFARIDAELTGMAMSVIMSNAVVYSTRAALFADLGQEAGTIGYVYDDATVAYNGFYRAYGEIGATTWELVELTLPADIAADLATQTGRIDAILGDGEFDFINNGATGNIGAGINFGSPSGVSNTRFGYGPGANLTTGTRNSLYGEYAGYALTTAARTVAVGTLALVAVTTGADNVAIGDAVGQALQTSAYRNTLVGSQAMAGASSTGYENTIVGYGAGYNATGHGNVFLGNQSGQDEAGSNKLYIDNKSGDATEALIYGIFGTGKTDQSLTINGTLNVYDGSIKLVDELGGDYGNVSILVGTPATLTGHSNTRVGYKAGLALTDGIGNTTYGEYAGYSVAGGDHNTAIGMESIVNITSGSGNIGIGHNAGYALQAGSSNNIIIGNEAFVAVSSTVNNNTFIGDSAGYFADGSANVFLGYHAGLNFTGSNKLVIDNKDSYDSTFPLIYGVFAADPADQIVRLNAEVTVSQPLNVQDGRLSIVNFTNEDGLQGNQFCGYNSGVNLTTGGWNTCFGFATGESLTEGHGNTLIGHNAGRYITSGINNTAVGWDSLWLLTTGQNNSTLGEDALKHTTGDANTAVGYRAGYYNTTGNYNTYAGVGCMETIVSGQHNVAMGWGAGNKLNAGSTGNVIIGYANHTGGSARAINYSTSVGYAAGQTATGEYNAFFGYGAGSDATGDYNICIGYNAGTGITGGAKIVIGLHSGVAASTGALIYGTQTGTATSQALTINGQLTVNNSCGFGFSDALFNRDTTAQVGLRSGTTAQSLAIYNTSSSSNTIYERYRARWSSNVMVVGCETASGTVRRVEHTTTIHDGFAVKTSISNAYTKVAAFEATGLTTGQEAYFELGLPGSAANLGYFGFKLVGSGSSSNYVKIGLESALSVLCIAGTGVVSFGGVTSGSPGVKPSGTVLQVRTADDSAFASLRARLQLETTAAPSSTSDTGTAGEIRQDASYIYICTATNTWKRVAIATW